MRSLRHRFAALGALLALGVAGGCASPVPASSGVLAGRTITVTIQCNDIMDSHFYYYFLINRVGSTGTNGARGPIPVIGPSVPGVGGYGNGFATGSSGSNTTPSGIKDYGITDYVVYNQSVQNQIQVCHFNGDPNYGSVISQGSPASYMLPDVNNPGDDPTGSRTLTFTLKVSQLLTTAEQEGLTTPAQIANAANSIQYIQVNIVATNLVPVDQTTPVQKIVDSMGDGRNPSELTSFLQIDLTQNPTIYSYESIGTLSPEPVGDLYPAGSSSPSIDLTYWKIQVASQ